MNKKIIIIITLILTVLVFSNIAFAQSQEQTLPKSGFLPDSPFYFLKKIGEEIKTFLIFGDAKIERQLYLAEKRLAEAKAMIDKKIQGSLNVDGEYESSETVDRIYKEPDLGSAEYFPKNLKVISLDIETSIDGNSLYCISMYSDEYKKSFIVSIP